MFNISRKDIPASRILYGCVDWNTSFRRRNIQCIKSHPIRVRGLKHLMSVRYQNPIRVASYTGAWIETLEMLKQYAPAFQSHPIRVRGLKRRHYIVALVGKPSHPIRVRGLKPHTVSTQSTRMESHPIRVRGLKQKITPSGKQYNSRILYGCVDWNHLRDWQSGYPKGRILYGCVDWNLYLADEIRYRPGRILYGCVDWNTPFADPVYNSCSRILYGCVDWNEFFLRHHCELIAAFYIDVWKVEYGSYIWF